MTDRLDRLASAARQPPAPHVPGTSDEDSPAVPDAARAVLSRMRASARAAQPGSGGTPKNRKTGLTQRRRAAAGYSGPGPDARDPQRLGSAWGDLVAAAGWGTALTGASLQALWPQIVGPTNAEHAVPESFDPDTGALVVRTSSTAWAEQLRLMLPTLRAAIDGRVGQGVVRDIVVVGPAPPRTKGRLRVRGRGPRDTYG